MKPPRFSVIMAAYDAERTVEPAIRSALLQTVDSLEVVVVDDGSRDETARLVQGLAQDDNRVRLFRQGNRGPGAARNRATAESRGELVVVLDADDLLLPDYLERMGAALDTTPGAGMAFTDAWLLEDETGRVRRRSAMALQHPPAQPPADPGELFTLLLEQGNFIYVSTTTRRVVLEDVGPWNESVGVKGVEDYELWLRILARGHRVIAVPGRLGVYRRRVGSNSYDVRNQYACLGRVYGLVADEWAVDDETRAIALRCRDEANRLLRTHDSGGGLRDTARTIVRTRLAPLRDRLVWLDRVPPDVAAVLESTAGQPPR